MNEQLFHLRWVRLVLLVEKWMSVLVMGFFFLCGLNPLAATVLAFTLFFLYIFAHNHYHTLEDAAGLPSNHLIVRF
jgi:hypothetical protein